MADTLFPKREERVPYSGGKTVEGGKDGKKKKNGQKAERGRKTQQPKKRSRDGGKRRQIPNRRALLLLGFVLLVVVFIFARKNGSAVLLAGERVGVLENRKVSAEELTTTLESQLGGIVGSKVKINEEITVNRIHIGGGDKKDVCTMEHLLPKLRNMVTYQVEAAIITVDGGRAAVLANEETANAVLEQVQKDLMPEEGVAEDAEIGWQEKVEVVKEFVDSDEILEQEAAVAALETTTETTQSYTVQSGDTLYVIAQEWKTTVEKLLSLNEGAELSNGIRVGQVINVPLQKPKISVKTVETQVLTAVEPKTYQTQYDDTKPASYQKVVQQGKAGQKKSTIRITRVNGVVTEEKEVDKEIIQEAVPEIIVKGTQ